MRKKSRGYKMISQMVAFSLAAFTLGAMASSTAFSDTQAPATAATAAPVKIAAKWALNDQVRYKAQAQVSGTMSFAGSTEKTPIAVGLEMVLKCSVVKPAAPNTTDILINTESATALVDGQRLQAPMSPKSTITLDATGKITNISGADRVEGISGMNVSSLMALLLPTFPNKELKTGDTWSSETAIPAANSKLTSKYTFLGTEKVGTANAAIVKQVFELTPLPAKDGTVPKGAKLSGDAISDFLLTNGRLVKSQAQIAIDAKNVGQDSPSVDAKVKLDVNLFDK